VIRALVLDYGGVLSTPQGTAERAEMQGILGAESDAFHRAYWEHRAAYDRGDLGGGAYWTAVAGSLGADLPRDRLGDLLRADACSWSHLDARMVGWARAVAERVPTALLSNMPHEVKGPLLPAIRGAVPFAAMVFSCDAGIVKPDPAIYLRCAEILGVAPSQALMVDDRPDNVEGAQRAGMRAVRFTTAERLWAAVDPLLAASAA
jgi:putative hydrolase of the HAD superfamily